MVALDDALVRNLTEAFRATDKFAAEHNLDLWDVRDVTTLMLVTESGGGYIYGNDGQGFREPDSPANRTPWNWDSAKGQPIGDPTGRAVMRAILRKSIDRDWLTANGLHIDRIGNNGRSTGPAQQLSKDTGGGWGSMQETLRMSTSVGMFLAAVQWTNRDLWYPKQGAPGARLMANWQTAMVLRVQRPLASEVETNYGAAQLARAQEIARDPRFAPGTIDEGDWFMAASNWEEALAELKGVLDQKLDKTEKDLAGYIVSNDVQNAQAQAIFAADTGAGSSYAAQIATQTRMIDELRRDVRWLIDQAKAPAADAEQ